MRSILAIGVIWGGIMIWTGCEDFGSNHVTIDIDNAAHSTTGSGVSATPTPVRTVTPRPTATPIGVYEPVDRAMPEATPTPSERPVIL